MAISIGLELGDSILRAVILEQQETRVRLIAQAQLPWSGEAAHDLTASLTQLRKTLPISHPVVVGIPTSCAIVTTVQPLVVRRKRAALAVEFELQQHLPYDADQAVWHYQWLTPPPRFTSSTMPAGMAEKGGGINGRSDAVVAATKQPLLEERLTCCRQAGLTIQAVGVSALAAVNTWCRQLELGVIPHGVLLNIDGAALEWIVVSPSGLHVFPTFRNLEARDPAQLAANVKTSYTHLHELLETKIPPPVSPPQAAIGLTGQSSPLANETGGGAGHTVWLLGGPAALHLLAGDLKRELGCAVEVVDPSRILTSESTSPSNLQQLVVACGLALQGLGKAWLSMNLLAESQRTQRLMQTHRLARWASWLCVALVAVFSASAMLTTLTSRQRRLATLTKQAQTYQMLRPEVRGMLQRQLKVEQRLRQLQDVAFARVLVSQAFQRVVEVLPDEVWLTKLEFSKLSPVASSAAQEGGRLEGVLQGYSRSFQGVTQLMDSLRTSVGWAVVRPLATTVTTDPASGEELVSFTVQIQHTLPTTQAEPAAPQQDKPASGKQEAAKKLPAGKSSRQSEE